MLSLSKCTSTDTMPYHTNDTIHIIVLYMFSHKGHLVKWAWQILYGRYLVSHLASQFLPGKNKKVGYRKTHYGVLPTEADLTKYPI